MEDSEFPLIHSGIKKRLRKKVKELKKLYYATIDIDNANDFHSNCDNIPNTLVLIKTSGNRRFGGFTSVEWTSSVKGEYKHDPNAFLFSLDKQKIYSYSGNKNAIYNRKTIGPKFGNYDFYINPNCQDEKNLFTFESYSGCIYNYNGDNNALSEDGKNKGIYAVEYEVFQVIFE